MQLKSTITNRFNFQIVNSLTESWGVCLTWLDCKRNFGGVLVGWEIQKFGCINRGDEVI